MGFRISDPVYKMLYTKSIPNGIFSEALYLTSGGDTMEKLKPGDRIWVKTPRLVAERKIGTIMATKKTRNGLRYIVEWDVDLEETPNHHPGYLEKEIASMNH